MPDRRLPLTLRPAGGPGKERGVPQGLLGSLLLHLVAVTLIADAAGFREFDPVIEQSIDVVIVASPSTAPPAAPEADTVVPDAGRQSLPAGASSGQGARAEAPPLDETSHPAPPVMQKPAHMLSDSVLNDPRSRAAKKALSHLARDERAAQLCSLEGMAQVAAWKKSLHPDLLIAYAMADAHFSGHTLLADGAALHSRHEWYNMRFKCALTPDDMKVAAFEFSVGDEIPRREWASHNLPTQGGTLD